MKEKIFKINLKKFKLLKFKENINKKKIMFAFLSKRITIPNNLRVDSISWNKDQGFVACGGEKGLLKILKLEEGKNQSTQGFSVNMLLEGHSGSVNVVNWNESYKKLTTSDENGLIIVWMMHSKGWVEEMINNRNKSIVTDMMWSPDGQKICIIYEDGAVILGSVEGNRLWGKEFNHRLISIEWSPDGKYIVFGTPEGEVRIYDQNGNSIHQLKLYCLQNLVDKTNLMTPMMKLASVRWYSGSKMHTDDTPPGLAIAFQCGRIQLMKNDCDDDPILIDSTMNINDLKWNPFGTIFAVSGNIDDGQDKRGIVQFYNNQGIYLKSLRIPGSDNVNKISWEGNGLRIGMTIGSSVYFASIKPDYKWAYMSMNKTLVFAYQKSDRIDFCVIFWDTKTDAKNIKYVKNLQWIKAAGEYCLLISKIEENADQYMLILCNSIGNPLDTKHINIEPVCVAMSKTHIAICSYDHIYCWHYKQPTRLTTFSDTTSSSAVGNALKDKRRFGKENAWFIDELPNANFIYDKDKYSKDGKTTDDQICAVTANESYLFVGRLKGSIFKYTLPQITLENKQYVKSKPSFITINNDSTRLAVIHDLNGLLSIYEVNNQGGTIMDFEKKEVWDVKWAEDQPNSFVCMEKCRMYTVKGTEPEEPIQTEGYICSYTDLQVRSVFLDEIMKFPDTNIKSSSYLVDFETKTLRDTKDIINKVNPKEAYAYIEQNPHPRLWRLFIEKSFDDLDFISAEKALIKCEDYQGLQLVKKLQLNIDDKSKQKAEILTYYGKYDEAEAIYKKIGRKDLEIQLRMKIGDWFKLGQMLKEGSGYDDVLQIAYNALGDYYADRFKWEKAVVYYTMSKNYESLIESYYNLEDFNNLGKLIHQLPETSPLILDLADKFQQFGLCEYAVQCFTKIGEIKQAIDCCVLLNHWNLAVELAEQHNFVQIEGLLSTYANILLQKRKKLEAAELYRKANRNTDSAIILSQIANDLIERDSNPVTIKKLYVMAALEVESHKRRVFDATMTGQNLTTQKTLDTLITSDINTNTDKVLNNPWRGAEAWHFYLLAQRQLYNKQYNDALKTAKRLAEYELELDTKKVYSVIAIASYYNKNFKECSKAFVKLEGITNLSEAERTKFVEISVAIFTKNQPINPAVDMIKCIGKTCKENIFDYETHCNECGSNFQPCIASGRSIYSKDYYICKGCKHKIIQSEIKLQSIKNCPLCHTPIIQQGDNKKLN